MLGRLYSFPYSIVYIGVYSLSTFCKFYVFIILLINRLLLFEHVSCLSIFSYILIVNPVFFLSLKQNKMVQSGPWDNTDEKLLGLLFKRYLLFFIYSSMHWIW